MLWKIAKYLLYWANKYQDWFSGYRLFNASLCVFINFYLKAAPLPFSVFKHISFILSTEFLYYLLCIKVLVMQSRTHQNAILCLSSIKTKLKRVPLSSQTRLVKLRKITRRQCYWVRGIRSNLKCTCFGSLNEIDECEDILPSFAYASTLWKHFP